MSLIIETERLILRAWKLEDANWFYEYAKNPNIGPKAGWPIHSDLKYSQDLIKKIADLNYCFAIELKTLGHIIGNINIDTKENSSLYLHEDEAEISYWLAEDFWGQGLMSEACVALIDFAFKKLKLDKIWSSCYIDNKQSAKLQDRLGFIIQRVKYNVYNIWLKESFNVNYSSLEKEDFYKSSSYIKYQKAIV